MREIQAKDVTATVARLAKEANYYLGEDVSNALKRARDTEKSPVAKEVLDQILENARIAKEEQVPLCQDCGTAVVFLEVGQELHIAGGDLNAAVDQGIREGYGEGYLRKSMVNQPYSERVNTRDNTPAVIYTTIVPGDHIKITVVPKGGGAENMGRLFMLKPAQGRQGVIDAVVQAVSDAGSNPCPPIIVGVGIGGTMEKAALLAKQSLIREVDEPNPNAEVAELEAELLKRVNATGIGAEGFGGAITALAVHVETFPAHIASLPVAVNIQCNSARHKEAVL